MTDNIADRLEAFLKFCDQSDVQDGYLAIRYDPDTLTVRQHYRLIDLVTGLAQVIPEETDAEHIGIMVAPRTARDIALTVSLAWSPAERYHTAITVDFGSIECEHPWVLVPEVTLGEGRGER